MDEVENAIEYVETSFAVMGIDVPMTVINGKTKRDIKKALGMCAHWTAIGQVASLREWTNTMHPPKPHPFPSGTMYPGD